MAITTISLPGLSGLDVMAHLFTLFDSGAWVTLMLTGVSAIVAAFVLESYGHRLRGQVVKQAASLVNGSSKFALSREID